MTLIGHLAADVDLRQTKSGRSLASFSLAINRFVKDQEGKKRSMADFHRIIAWEGLAKICNNYLNKGSAVLIEGRLINRSFDDKEGNKVYRTEIIADNLNILTSKKSKTGKHEVVVEDFSESQVQEEALVAA